MSFWSLGGGLSLKTPNSPPRNSASHRSVVSVVSAELPPYSPGSSYEDELGPSSCCERIIFALLELLDGLPVWSPQSSYLSYWNFTVGLCVAYVAIYVPMQAAFDELNEPEHIVSATLRTALPSAHPLP